MATTSQLSKYFFQKGNTYGKGRPKGSVNDTRLSLMRSFLGSVEKEWPKLVQQMISEAKAGNVRMMELLVQYALLRPSHTTIEFEESKSLEHKENAENLTSQELREIMKEFARRKEIKDSQMTTEGELVE